MDKIKQKLLNMKLGHAGITTKPQLEFHYFIDICSSSSIKFCNFYLRISFISRCFQSREMVRFNTHKI